MLNNTFKKSNNDTHCIFEWISVNLIERNIGPRSFKDTLRASKMRTLIGLYKHYTFLLRVLDFFSSELKISTLWLGVSLNAFLKCPASLRNSLSTVTSSQVNVFAALQPGFGFYTGRASLPLTI